MSDNTTFQIANGKQLTISNQLLFTERQKHFTVTIEQEDEESILLSNASGIKASIPKEILSINQIEPVNGKLTLSDTMYFNYFKSALKRWNRNINRALLKNLDTILQNKHLIMSHAEYFLLRSENILGSAAYIGDVYPCLGGLLEAWETSELLKVKSDDNHDAFILHVGGSPLSGTNSYTAMIPENGNLINGQFKQSWMIRQKEFADIAKKYPWYLRHNLSSAEKLLKELNCNLMDS